MPSYKVSDYVVRYLAAQGVTHVYELSGGMLAHLLDSFSRLSLVRLVSMHHEQGAGFAAEAHARMTGIPAIAMATSGPGATNLLTPIGSCHFDSTPAVFITGQVNRHELKGRRAIRQLGFQETDIVSIARPITKLAFRVDSPEDVPRALERAFRTALEGRPGPVLVDLPMDVQRMAVSAPAPRKLRPASRPMVPKAQLAPLAQALDEAQRPLILVGGGVRSARAVESCRRVVSHLGVPVVHSLMGLDVLGHEHPLRVGMIGSYGNRWGNLALGHCDLLLVLGSRLDVRQTGSETAAFSAGRRIFHVDCEPGEINKRIKGEEPIIADLNDFFAAVLRWPRRRRHLTPWVEWIEATRARWPDTEELRNLPGLNPNVFLRRLGEASRGASAIVVDVGQHQMWAGQSLVFDGRQRFLTSGGMGSMGFALPAAIGASLAVPGKPVLVVAGDGGFQTNIQELQAVVRNDLPLKLVVLNNHSHGMVRQFQESYFGGRFQSTVIGYSAPDFARIASAYGLAARRLATETLPAGRKQDEVVREAIRWLWEDPGAPRLLDVGIPLAANAYPKLAFGLPITEMEPQAKPLEMEGT